MFLNNVLTPLDIEATHLEKPESEESDSDQKLNEYNRRLLKHRLTHGFVYRFTTQIVSFFHSSGSRIQKTEHKKPRMTTVLEPLQLPALRFHVQRLFQSRYQRLKCSMAPVTSTKKCRVCRDDSACSCLLDPSTGDDRRYVELEKGKR